MKSLLTHFIFACLIATSISACAGADQVDEEETIATREESAEGDSVDETGAALQAICVQRCKRECVGNTCVIVCRGDGPGCDGKSPFPYAP